MYDYDKRNLVSKLGLAALYLILALLALVGNCTIVIIYFKWKSSFKIYKV